MTKNGVCSMTHKLKYLPQIKYLQFSSGPVFGAQSQLRRVNLKKYFFGLRASRSLLCLISFTQNERAFRNVKLKVHVRMKIDNTHLAEAIILMLNSTCCKICSKLEALTFLSVF